MHALLCFTSIIYTHDLHFSFFFSIIKSFYFSHQKVSEILPKKFVDERMFYYLSGVKEIKDIQNLRIKFKELKNKQGWLIVY